MTIQSNVNDGITHSGNGSTTNFSFPFKVNSSSQVEVIIRDANGDETVLSTNYTVNNPTVEGSGTVDYPDSGDALPSGSKITIQPKMDYLQSTDLRNQGRFAPETHEDAFDTLMMHIKELKGEVNRTIQFKKSSELTGAEFGEDPVDNRVIAWDGTTGKTKNLAAADIEATLVSAFWEAVLDETDLDNSVTALGGASAVRTAIGTAIGSDVQAWDADLDAFAGLTGAADKIPYYTGAGTMSVSNLPSNRNLIINGQGVVSQRGTSFDSSTTPANSDDTYLLDRMLLLSDGNDIVDVSQETTEIPNGAYSSIKFDVETANKQFAYCQILEAKDAAKIIGGQASLSFKAKKGGSNSTLGTLRAAIISWSSTADSVTSDVIGTWAGAGTDPTLASNWTYENTPSDLTLTTSFQTFKIEDVDIDTASAANVAVLIWCDDTDATVGDLAYIGDIQLEEGEVATPYENKGFEQELEKCLRFFQKSFNYATVPAQSAGRTGALEFFQNRTSGSSHCQQNYYAKPMRVSPTVTLYNPSAANAQIRNLDTGSDCSSSGVETNNEKGFKLTYSLPGSSDITNLLSVQWAASAEL